MGIEEDLRDERRRREDAGLARRLELQDETAGLADFVSNDVLGLSRCPALAEAAADAARRCGTGARASRLLGGGSPWDALAERAVAEWTGAEAALLFPSGYQANLGLLSALLGPEDVAISDERVHASSIDGLRLARVRVRVARHRDVAHVADLLERSSGARRKLVLTEGVFSMDGDRAPLFELAEVCARCGAALVVDEAHAIGVLGPEGAGAWAEARAAGAPESALLARVVTGGKALGVAGAFVVGSDTLRTHLVDRARGFVFTTGTAPPVAAALHAAVGRARAADAERATALDLARALAAELRLPPPAATIVPVHVGDDRAAVAAAAELRARGLDVRAVRPPTVPPGTARLRVACHATNTRAELDALIAGLRDLGLPAPLASRPAAREGRARTLVVAGTDTDVGKTVVSAALCRELARAGAVAYWKPVQTGDDDDTETVRALTAGRDVTFHAPHHRFALPASPHEAAAAEGARVDPAAVDAAFARHRARGGTLVVELAGGLCVPWTDELLQVDWLARRDVEVVLVARSGLGTLNHTLLSVEALRRRGVAVAQLWLVGPPHASNRATLAARVDAPLRELPRVAPLSPETLDAVLARAPEVRS